MDTKNQIKLFFACLLILGIAIFGILGICLSYECHYFHTQADELCDLKDDYNKYVTALKKIMSDYNKTKERLDLLENSLDNEKKNEIVDAKASNLTDFKSSRKSKSLNGLNGSSSNSDGEVVWVNREPSHLKHDAFKYILQEYNRDFFMQIPQDELMEYTDYLDQACHPKKNKINKPKNIGKKGGRYHRLKRVVKNKFTNGISISSDINFKWPIPRSKWWPSSLFGPRRKNNGLPGFHYGLDMAACHGTPVKAASSGIVMEARYDRGYGKTVLIAHNKKYKTRYGHLHKIYVSPGQKVEQGHVIGLVGNTGNVRGRNGSHLHFEVYTFNRRVNPLYYLID